MVYTVPAALVLLVLACSSCTFALQNKHPYPYAGLDRSVLIENLAKSHLDPQSRRVLASPFSRKHVFDVRQFGAVGDGYTLNTNAFRRAVSAIEVSGDGMLLVPQGVWLTGCFNLTSHMTLYLESGATILGSQDVTDWPVVAPLPSYGRGRELPGPRYGSLIGGQSLTDVVISGRNGTIDGQGSVWWDLYRAKELKYTRGHLVELLWSKDLVISNITLKNSPFWTLHPAYCDNVTVTSVTLLAPQDSPNTDGIDPDSSTNVEISNCYISVGDDAIAIKSGWDEYGIAYSRPAANISVQNVVAHTLTSAGVAIGSEMSGGVRNVTVKGLQVRGARRGVRIKTAMGRGGCVRDIAFQNVTLDNVTTAIEFVSHYGEHPDAHYNPNAAPVIKNILLEDIRGTGISIAGNLDGLAELPMENITLRRVHLVLKPKGTAFQCSFVKGSSQDVLPEPCPQLGGPFRPLKKRKR